MFRGSDSGEASRFPGKIMRLLLISAAFPPKSFLSVGETCNGDVPGFDYFNFEDLEADEIRRFSFGN